jgi:hypothetical protein
MKSADVQGASLLEDAANASPRRTTRVCWYIDTIPVQTTNSEAQEDSNRVMPIRGEREEKINSNKEVAHELSSAPQRSQKYQPNIGRHSRSGR